MPTPLAYQRVPSVPVGSGLAPAYVAADPAGHTFHNSGGGSLLHLKNAGGAAITATVHANPAATGGPPLADAVFTIPAGAEVLLGPFPAHEFDAAATVGPVITSAGRYSPPGYVTFSSVSGLSIACLTFDLGFIDRPSLLL